MFVFSFFPSDVPTNEDETRSGIIATWFRRSRTALCRARDLARGRGAPVAMLRSSSAPARCLRRAYAAGARPRGRAICGRKQPPRASPPTRTRPPRLRPRPPSSPRSTTPRWWLVAEIRALAVPTKVEVAVQADAYTLVLGLRAGGKDRAARVLHLAPRPAGPPRRRAQVREPLLRRAGAGAAGTSSSSRPRSPSPGNASRCSARRGPATPSPSALASGAGLLGDADGEGGAGARRRRSSGAGRA